MNKNCELIKEIKKRERIIVELKKLNEELTKINDRMGEINDQLVVIIRDSECPDWRLAFELQLEFTKLVSKFYDLQQEHKRLLSLVDEVT